MWMFLRSPVLRSPSPATTTDGAVFTVSAQVRQVEYRTEAGLSQPARTRKCVCPWLNTKYGSGDEKKWQHLLHNQVGWITVFQCISRAVFVRHNMSKVSRRNSPWRVCAVCSRGKRALSLHGMLGYGHWDKQRWLWQYSISISRPLSVETVRPINTRQPVSFTCVKISYFIVTKCHRSIWKTCVLSYNYTVSTLSYINNVQHSSKTQLCTCRCCVCRAEQSWDWWCWAGRQQSAPSWACRTPSRAQILPSSRSAANIPERLQAERYGGKTRSASGCVRVPRIQSRVQLVWWG